jgi:hypothetical protein
MNKKRFEREKTGRKRKEEKIKKKEKERKGENI